MTFFNLPPMVTEDMRLNGLTWRKDSEGEWHEACNFCGGNCGQCGMTGRLGNVPASMGRMASNLGNRSGTRPSIFPRVSRSGETATPRRISLARLIFLAAFLLTVAVVLAGCGGSDRSSPRGAADEKHCGRYGRGMVYLQKEGVCILGVRPPL